MAKVGEYQEGHCMIHIDDGHCLKSQEDWNAVLHALSEIYSRYFSDNPQGYGGEEDGGSK